MHTNDPVVPILRLIAAGNTNRGVVVEPDFLDLGMVLAGRTRITAVVVWSSGDHPVPMTKVGASVKGVAVRYRVLDQGEVRAQLALTQSDVRMLAGSQAVILSFHPVPRLAGRTEGVVYVYTTIHGFERITIPVRMQVVPPVSLRPPTLFLGDVSPGAAFRRQVRVVAESDSPIRVDHVDVTGTGLRYEVTQDTPRWPCLLFTGRLKDPVRLSGKRISVGVTVGDRSGRGFHSRRLSGLFCDRHRPERGAAWA